MNFQLRRRSLAVWFVVTSLCLVLFYLYQSENGSRLLVLWNGRITYNEPKPNAAIIMLISPSRMTEAMMALLNIEDRFNRRLKYPYVLLTEYNITHETRRKVDWITEGRATFADLPKDMWGVPEFLDRKKIDQSIESIGFTSEYRSMCRFYSGFFWRHPAVAQYDWIWRLDTDIEFHCDVPYDPFLRMRTAKALYGFVQLTGDVLYVQPSLAANVSAFLAAHPHLIRRDANNAFSWRDVEKAFRGEAGNEDWTVNVFYNNWEISHRSLWSSELYTSFFEYLDNAGGFFYERWGDAVVHTHGVSMSLRPDQVLHFEDMGYEHQHWPYDCPSLDHCACVQDALSESMFIYN
ncbi:glycosyltransferase family 15 protein [Ramaria rubella]|nr:glycosyltransferase family 15 protein [Ramaria rubella]